MTQPSFLVNSDLRDLASRGQSVVLPFDESAVQPASVDMRLSGEQYRYNCKSYRLGEKLPDAEVQQSLFEELEVPPLATVFVGISEEMRFQTTQWVLCLREAV